MSLPTPEAAPPQTQAMHPSILQIEGPRHHLGWKGKLAALGMTGLAAIGAYKTVGEDLGLPHIGLPHINLDLGNLFGGDGEPGKVEAEVKHETFRVQAKYDIECKANISAGVGVKGHRNYVLKLNTPVFNISVKTGTATVDKVLYGDEDLCADNGAIQAQTLIEGDKITNEKGVVTTKARRVIVTTPGLTPHRARLNHEMWQNMVDERSGDKPADITKKEDAWLKNKKHTQDDGFKVSGATGDAVADLKDTANTAAQAALSISEVPPEILDQQNARLKADLEAHFKELYSGAEVIVNVIPQPTQQQQDRINAEVANLQRNYYKVTVRQETNPQNHKVDTTLHIVSPGGTEIDVKDGTINAGDVSILAISKASEGMSTVTRPQDAQPTPQKSNRT